MRSLSSPSGGRGAAQERPWWLEASRQERDGKLDFIGRNPSGRAPRPTRGLRGLCAGPPVATINYKPLAHRLLLPCFQAAARALPQRAGDGRISHLPEPGSGPESLRPRHGREELAVRTQTAPAWPQPRSCPLGRHPLLPAGGVPLSPPTRAPRLISGLEFSWTWSWSPAGGAPGRRSSLPSSSAGLAQAGCSGVAA